MLEALINTFPDINPVWLLTGKGEMLLSGEENSHKLETSIKESEYRQGLINNEVVKIEKLVEIIISSGV